MSENATPTDRLETLTLDEMIEALVRTPEDRQLYLRNGWVHRVIMQLIRSRSAAGLTQAELGARMGKQQSAIARLERGDDLKLSTLFDYLAALDLTPGAQIPVVSYSEAMRRIPGAEDDEGADSPVQENRAHSDLAAH